MRVTLIKPNIGRRPGGPYVDEGRMEPLQMGVLAALTPPEHTIAFHDDRMEAIPFDRPTDLVAITVETYTAKRSYEIAAEYRARGVPVVMGGVHPTLIPDECAAHADSILLGDAETAWAGMLDDAGRGALKPVYRAAPGIAHPGLRPRRDIFAGKGYLPLALVQFSRGCRFSCDFCTVGRYFDGGHFVRRVDEVLAEIESQQRRLVFFVDDNICADRAAAKELFRALEGLHIRWVSQASLDMLKDREMMDLMLRSGCLGHVVGFESLSASNLAAMSKAPNLLRSDGFRDEVRALREYGLQTWAAFVLGYDHETRDSVRRTLDFALDSRFAFAAFNILMPFPGTPQYERLRSEGRLLYDGKWWLHPDYRFNSAPFRPLGMSADELTEACQEARAVFNSLPSMLYRLWDRKTHLSDPVRFLLYLKFNPLFRKEVHKKHGMLFGLKSVVRHALS